MAGAGTVKLTPLLDPLAFVTTTLPVVASVGTDVVMLVSVQLEMVALTPLKVTVPVLEPKRAPEMVTGVPAFPVVADKPLMLGGGGPGATTVESVTPPFAPLN